MAFRSNGPTMLMLPAFRGFTRKIILIAIAGFVLFVVVRSALPNFFGTLLDTTLLHAQPGPQLLWGIFTYPFVSLALLSTLFALYSIWTFGSSLEDDLGSRWLMEFYFAATAGGGVLAVLLAVALRHVMSGFGPDSAAFGMWPAAIAMLLAYARFSPDRSIILIVLPMKAKHVAALYLLIYLVLALVGGDRFGALTVLTASLAGYAYLQFAPRRGVRFAASESWFGWRNAWYRAKRRRAAKKFTVYMRKQGRDVNIGSDGRYIDPDGNPRDPNDRRWMN